MQRIRLILLALAMIVPANMAVAQQKGESKKGSVWSGTLDTPGMKLRIEIALKQEKGKTVGTLKSLDQGNATLKLEELKVTKSDFQFEIPRIAASFKGKFSKDGKQIKGTFKQGGMEMPLTLSKSSAQKQKKEKLKEAWIGNLDIGGMKPVMQFRLMETDKGKTVAYFDSVSERRTGFKAEWSKKDGQLTFDVEAINLQFEGELNKNGDEAEGIWSQGGREFPLTLKRKKVVEKAKTWRDRPQNPKAPFPYKSEDVVFENEKAKIKLAGTLTIPKKAGPHPAVILISGSGPQDRDETLMGHKPFLVLADYLSRRGIAVLRYDDRGSFKSTGDFSAATTQDFATDVSAAVDFLKTHKSIDAKRIGLAGHSEGGLIAPITAGARNDVAFVVIMAGTGVDGAAILKSQSRAMMEANGIDKKEVEIAAKMTEAVVEAMVKADPKKEDLSEDLENAIEKVLKTLPEDEREKQAKEVKSQMTLMKKRLLTKWMRYFLTYDPRPALRNMKCPTMVIIGGKDLQVLPKLNMPEIEKALDQSEAPEVVSVEIPNLNHLFQECKTGSINEYAEIEQTFSPKALKAIGDWVVKVTKANK